MRKTIVLLVLLFTGISAPCVDNPRVVHMTDAFGRIYWVSSELSPPERGLGRYGGHNLFDEDWKTAWAEGVPGSGIHQKIVVIVARPLEKIRIVNGYAKNREIFLANNRIRKIMISAFTIHLPRQGHVTESFVPVEFLAEISSFSCELKDTWTAQEVAPPSGWKRKLADQCQYALEIEILTVYPGAKYDDTCISELELIQCRENAVETRNEDSEVWVQRGKEAKRVVHSAESIFQIVDTDKENHWAIIIEMPNKTEGRAETLYRLLSIDHAVFIPPGRIGLNVHQLTGFEVMNGILYLTAFDSKKNADIRVDLSEVNP